MDDIIDYFGIYNIDKCYIKNMLSEIFNCKVEFGKYRYRIDGEICITEKYFFIVKINNYNSYFKNIIKYKYFTTSEIFKYFNYKIDLNYKIEFKKRHNHIFRSYKKEILEYINIYMPFFSLAYNSSVLFYDNKATINIVTKNNNYMFVCYYDLRGFNQLKNFINDITIKQQKGKL